MKHYLALITFLISVAFIVFRIMGNAPVFPPPQQGYSTEHAFYDSIPPEKPHIVSLVCDLSERESKALDFSNPLVFDGTDGISIEGKILHCDIGDNLALIVELSRKYKQTLQIVGSSSAVFQLSNGQCEIDLSIRSPKNVSKYNVTLLALPLDESGTPLLDSPLVLAEGYINLSETQ